MKTAIIALALVAAAGLAQAQEAFRGLRVTGEGRVTVEPGIARIMLGVGAEAETAGAAAEGLSRALGPVLDALSEAGLAPADLQTGTLQLGPVHAEPPSGPGGRPEIVGYRAESLVEVRLREIDRLGEILDLAIEAGANRMEGISFAASEPRAAQEAALAEAVADATRKARIASAAAGRSLGPIRALVEQGGGAGPAMMRMSAEAGIPVAPGEIEATAQVEITFDLRE